MRTHSIAISLCSILLFSGCQKTPVNMFENSTAQEALAEINKKIGHPSKALKVEIKPLALSVQVQDPAQPAHVDEYRFEHIYALDNRLHKTLLSGPNPVELNLINPNLEENLFNLADVNIAGIASIAKEAVQRCGLEEGGAVAEINIQRQLFLLPSAHSGDVRWDISVKSDRESANAFADAKGKITGLNLDGTNRAKNLNLYADTKELQNITGMMRSVLGASPSITQLHLERNYLWFTARNPDDPKKLMDFTANLNGVLMRAGGVVRPGRKPLEDAMCFAVVDVDWTGVPDLLKQAMARLAIPNGHIYKVSLDKVTITGDAKPLTWDIEVRDRSDDQDEAGEVEFDAKGTVTRTVLPKSRRVALNFFEPDSAKQALDGIRKKFGPHAKFMELLIDGPKAILIARDPKSPEHLRDFIYDQDHFSDFPGSDRTPFYRGFDDDWLFDLDDLDSAFLPQMAELQKKTLDRLKLAGGRIERITISKQRNFNPGNRQVLIEIRASGSGDKSGWVNYDMQGNSVSVMMP